MCQPALDEPSSYLKQGSLIWPPAGSKPKRERPAAILASLTPFDLWPTSLLNSFNLHHQLCFCILVISSMWQFQSLHSAHDHICPTPWFFKLLSFDNWTIAVCCCFRKLKYCPYYEFLDWHVCLMFVTYTVLFRIVHQQFVSKST